MQVFLAEEQIPLSSSVATAVTFVAWLCLVLDETSNSSCWKVTRTTLPPKSCYAFSFLVDRTVDVPCTWPSVWVLVAINVWAICVVCYVQLSQFHQMFLIVWFLQKGSQHQSCLQPKDELPPQHIISTLGGFVWDQSSSDVAMLYKTTDTQIEWVKSKKVKNIEN